jgi:hypothetical protein
MADAEGDSDHGDWYKGKPILRRWELNEDSTRYDMVAAAPSDDELHKYWWAWGIVAPLVGITSLVVFLGILTSRKAMKNSFNVYILYLAIPDFIFSFSCGVTCLLNAINGEYWAAWMCNFQQWYCVFGIGSNAWLNACITRELYTMLKFSDMRRRYKSPTQLFVTKQAMVVYLCIGFLGVCGIIEAPNWPFHSGSSAGLACLPIVVDTKSSIFFWLAFFPLFAGIPSTYIVFVTYQIWKRNLLPPTDKRRLLTVYFGRLVLVFYVMWLPTLVILFVLPSFVPPWAHFWGGMWSHLQGAVSSAIAVLKPDIYDAVKTFLTCQSCSDGKSGNDRETTTPENPHHTPNDSLALSDEFEAELGTSGRRREERRGSSTFLSTELWPSSQPSLRNMMQMASMASSQEQSMSMALEDLAEEEINPTTTTKDIDLEQDIEEPDIDQHDVTTEPPQP